MLKAKEVIINELIENSKNELSFLEIREKYLQQKEVLAKTSKTVWTIQLGQVQSQIRELKEWVGWLEKYEKEL